MNAIDTKPTSVQEIVQRWHGREDFIIEMLQDVQDTYRYLPEEVLKEISGTIPIPLSRIYHLSTFFKMFSLVPRGKYVINVCTGTACHVKGADRILDTFSRELKIDPGQTTSDHKFTLESVRCLGCCGLAPVVTINEELFGNLGSAKVTGILKKY